METSFMYHCLGIREQECTRTRYEGGKTILEIRTREDKLYCPKCKSRHVIKSGSTIRQFKCVLIGVRPIILEMTVQRLECKDCGAVQQERIHLVAADVPVVVCCVGFVIPVAADVSVVVRCV